MTRSIIDNAAFIAEKNAKVNGPIWLYNIELVPGSTAYDIKMAEWDTDITYKGLVFVKYPITHDGISENSSGEIDSLNVTISNVSREMSAYIEANDGLRGLKVTIWQVFKNLLADTHAYIEDVFWIDSCGYNQQAATFVLKGKIDLVNITIPTRKFSRDYCQFTYKGYGCWEWSDSGDPGSALVASATFTAGSPDTCNHRILDCERHCNQARFGAFPGIPSRRVQT